MLLLFSTLHIHHLFLWLFPTSHCNRSLFLTQFFQYGRPFFLLFRSFIIHQTINHIVILFFCDFCTSQILPIFLCFLPVLKLWFFRFCYGLYLLCWMKIPLYLFYRLIIKPAALPDNQFSTILPTVPDTCTVFNPLQAAINAVPASFRSVYTFPLTVIEKSSFSF